MPPKYLLPVILAAAVLAFISLRVSHLVGHYILPDVKAAISNLPLGKTVTIKVNDDSDHSHNESCNAGAPSEAMTKRNLTWDEGEKELTLAAPAKLEYRPNGPKLFSASGKGEFVSHLDVSGGTIALGCSSDKKSLGKEDFPEIVLSGVTLDRLEIAGVGHLTLADVTQDSLELTVSGAGLVDGNGRADQLEVNISGASKVDLGQLAAKTANVNLSGAADARLNVSDNAEVSISGIGQVHWTKRPTTVDSHVSGLGRVAAEADK